MTARTRPERVAAILEEVLAISGRQERYLSENNLEDLLRAQQSREALLAELAELDPDLPDSGPLRDVLNRILENDRRITLNIETSLTGIRRRLEKLRKGSMAMRAYSST